MNAGIDGADIMADDEDVKPRKEREPISFVCFVVLIVATLAVAGTYVNDNMLSGDSEVSATNGSTVYVEYTGALYAQYDEGGAIFDTNVESIANSTSYVHSAGYTIKETYSNLEVKIGSGGALAPFENVLIGYKEGDVVTVVISAESGEGYVVPNTTAAMANSFQVPVQQKMSASAYKSLYGEDAVSGTTVTTVYGWDAAVTVNTDGTVSLNNMAVKGVKYDIESDFATVKAEVTDVSSGNITYSLDITETQSVDGSTYSDFSAEIGSETYSAVKMIKVPMYSGTGDTSIYIIGGNSDYSMIEYRTVGDTKNVTLYFTIKVVSVS